MARKHLDAIRRSVRRRTAAEIHLEDAILEAREWGETIADICAAAGMGRTKIYKMIKQARARRDK